LGDRFDRRRTAKRWFYPRSFRPFGRPYRRLAATGGRRGRGSVRGAGASDV